MRVPKTHNIYKYIINTLNQIEDVKNIFNPNDIRIYASNKNKTMVIFIDAEEFYPASLDDNIDAMLAEIQEAYSNKYIVLILQIMPLKDYTDSQDFEYLKSILSGEKYIPSEAGIIISKDLPDDKFVRIYDENPYKLTDIQVIPNDLIEEVYYDFKTIKK